MRVFGNMTLRLLFILRQMCPQPCTASNLAGVWAAPCLFMMGMLVVLQCSWVPVPPCDFPKLCNEVTLQAACAKVLACNSSQSIAVRAAAPNRNRRGLKTQWFSMHTSLQHEAKELAPSVTTLFLGDSITEAYRGTNIGGACSACKGVPQIFKKYFPANATAFGIGADETQHLLWRLQHSEVTGLQPLKVVVLIGTNNFGIGNMTGPETFMGVAAVAELLLHLLHERAQIVLMGILPRARHGKFQGPIAFVNKQMATLAQTHRSRRLHYLPCGHVFVDSEGVIIPSLMPDLLHPSSTGTDLMFGKCVVPFLQRI